MSHVINERQNLDLLERTYDRLMSNNVGISVNINPTFLPQEYRVKISTNINWITSPITDQQVPYQILFDLPSNDKYMTPLNIKTLESSGNYQTYEENQQPKVGTPEYIKTIIGEKGFALLSKNDRDFLVNSAGIFDLGKNVDIEKMLRKLNDE